MFTRKISIKICTEFYTLCIAGFGYIIFKLKIAVSTPHAVYLNF